VIGAKVQIWLGVVAVAVMAAFSAAGAQECLRCHGLPGLKSEQGKIVYVDSSAYRNSAHGGLPCTACHPGDWSYPHTEAGAPVECGQCHQGALRDYSRGVHGRDAAEGNPDVPTCERCHGVHDVLPMARLVEERQAMHNLLIDKCAECHTDSELMRKYGVPLDRFATYETSAHGRADRFGSVAVARCATCHGFHAILPPDDPRSPVNPENLPTTCGKCHEDAERFLGRKYHGVAEATPSLAGYNSVLRGFYWTLLVLGAVGTVFFAIVGFRGEG